MIRSLTLPARPADETIAQLIDLAENESRLGHFEAASAVSRLISERAPDEPEPHRLMSLVSPSLPADDSQRQQQPSGLTVVTGLDPTSRVLTEGYEAAVERFIETPFLAIESDGKSALNVVPNDWNLVQSRLRERRII